MKTLSWAQNQVRRGGAIQAAVNGLVGCPVGGWGKTAQAMRRLCEELPTRSARSFTVWELVDSCLMEVGGDRYSAGRYAWRPVSHETSR